jgi:hypothetical protein
MRLSRLDFEELLAEALPKFLLFKLLFLSHSFLRIEELCLTDMDVD